MGTLNTNLPGRVQVGIADPSILSKLSVVANSNLECEVTLKQYSTDINAPTHNFYKARGTFAAPANVAQNDRLLSIRALALSGGTFFDGATMRVEVDDAVVNGQRPASRIVWETNRNNAAAARRMGIFNNGFVAIGDELVDLAVTDYSKVPGILSIGQDGVCDVFIMRASADAASSTLSYKKSRGTLAAPADVVVEDVIGVVAAFPFSGVYQTGAKMQIVVDAAVVNNQAPATRFEWFTTLNNAAPVLRGRFTSLGTIQYGEGMLALPTTSAFFTTIDGHAIGSDAGEPSRHFFQVRSSTTNGPNHYFNRMRGTFADSIAAPSNCNVIDGDRVISVRGQAWSGATGWFDTARIDSLIDAAVVDNQAPATRLSFFTNAVNAAPSERLRIHNNGRVNIGPGAGATAGGSAASALVFGTAATPVLGVYFGSGVPTITVGKGSLYLRTDGGGVNTRAYIATDAAGTWTALVTVA